MASPHTRGWTLGEQDRHGSDQGFPAHAGMDPSQVLRAAPVPEVRGGARLDRSVLLMALEVSTLAKARIFGRHGLVLAMVSDEGEWVCADGDLLSLLKRDHSEPSMASVQPGQRGDAAHMLAGVAVSEYGGEVLTRAPDPPRAEPGRVY